MAWGFHTLSDSQRHTGTSLGSSITTQALKTQETVMAVTPITGIVQSPGGVSAYDVGVAMGTGVKVLAGNYLNSVGQRLSAQGQQIIAEGQATIKASLSPLEKLFDFAGKSFGTAFGGKTIPYVLLIGGAILVIYYLKKKGG